MFVPGHESLAAQDSGGVDHETGAVPHHSRIPGQERERGRAGHHPLCVGLDGLDPSLFPHVLEAVGQLKPLVHIPAGGIDHDPERGGRPHLLELGNDVRRVDERGGLVT